MGIDSLKESAYAFAREYTVPIVVYRGKWIKVLGTGILVKHESNPYLISAAHIFTEGKNKIFIPDTPANGVFSYPDLLNIRNTHQYDIAALKLYSSSAEKVSNAFSFLDINHLDFNYENDGIDNYLLFGYPASKIKYKDGSPENYSTVPLAITEERITEGLKAPTTENTFTVNYSRKDKTNNKLGPLPYGMSGSGLWAYNQTTENSGTIALIGIAVYYHDSPIDKMVVAKIDILSQYFKQKSGK